MGSFEQVRAVETVTQGMIVLPKGTDDGEVLLCKSSQIFGEKDFEWPLSILIWSS